MRTGEVGAAHYPKWHRSLLIRAETGDFHLRREMGEDAHQTIVDQYSIKSSSFIPSCEALGRLLKKNKKKEEK